VLEARGFKPIFPINRSLAIKNMQRKVALNYFYSSEFLNTLQVVGITSTPYIALIAKTGFSLDGILMLLFAGIIGGIAKARKDLETSPNLYTPVGLIGTDPAQAIAYVAHNIALEQATREVISKNASDRINEVAKDIVAKTPFPELLKPYAEKTASNLFRRIIKR
jgi:hypothetical protein